MPSAPGAYNSGSYPAPDQNNGISIYNSNAPQSQDGGSQAGNYRQSEQPVNGTQPPDYDHPISQQDQQQNDRDCQGISGLSSVGDGKVTYTAPYGT